MADDDTTVEESKQGPGSGMDLEQAILGLGFVPQDPHKSVPNPERTPNTAAENDISAVEDDAPAVADEARAAEVPSVSFERIEETEDTVEDEASEFEPPPIPPGEPGTVRDLPAQPQRYRTTQINLAQQSDSAEALAAQSAIIKSQIAAQMAVEHQRAEAAGRTGRRWQWVVMFAVGYLVATGVSMMLPDGKTPADGVVGAHASAEPPVRDTRTAPAGVEKPKLAQDEGTESPTPPTAAKDNKVEEPATTLTSAPTTEDLPAGAEPPAAAAPVDTKPEAAPAPPVETKKEVPPSPPVETKKEVPPSPPVESQPEVAPTSPEPSQTPAEKPAAEPVNAAGFRAEVTVGMNLRAGPNQKSRAVGSVGPGTVVQVLGRREHNVYVFVIHGEKRGWLAAFRGYLKPQKGHTFKELPVVDRRGRSRP